MKQGILLLSLFVVFGSVAWACDTPVSLGTNPSTGNQERVCSVWDGHDFEVYWYEKVNGSWSAGTQLTDNSIDDVAASLSIDVDGSTGVVWRASGSTGQIYYRGRKDLLGIYTWQLSAVAVSDGLNDASAPAITFHSGQVHVGWHESTSSGTEVMSSAGDGSVPWPEAFDIFSLGTTAYAGNLLLSAHSEDSHLWIVWVDSTADLGYVEWDATGEDWSAVSSESYSGPTDIPAAKTRVRDAIVL